MKLNIEGIKGCTDHGCLFGHPGGMGTNGGCNCLRDVRPFSERVRLVRNVHLLTKEIERLRNDLTAARLENANYEDEIVAQIAITRKREAEIERLNQRCQAMGWRLYPHSDPPRAAVAGDIGWPT